MDGGAGHPRGLDPDTGGPDARHGQGTGEPIGLCHPPPVLPCPRSLPTAPTEIEPQAVDQVARQIGMGTTPPDGLDLAARTWKRHRAEIRALFGYREATVADAEALEDWLRDQAAVVGAVPDHLVARLEARCRELSIEPPSADRVDRIVRAAIHAHDERLYAGIRDRLTLATRARLEALLRPASDAGGQFGQR